MTLEIYMIGLIVEDMTRSLEFYRRLGVAIPDGSDGKTHVQVKMGNGFTFFLDSAPSRWDPSYTNQGAFQRPNLPNAYPFLLEFYLKDRQVLEAKYQELIGFGYQSHHAPYQMVSGMYFAFIKDPDGHVILLSSD